MSVSDRFTPHVEDVLRVSREPLPVDWLPDIALEKVDFSCQTSGGAQMTRAF